MNLWTNEEIQRILIQLDHMNLPFKKYGFVMENNGLKLLGRGGSADVYEAKNRSSNKRKYAIKVIGFKEHNMDSNRFIKSVQAQKDLSLLQENIIKTYDHVELWLSFDEHDCLIEATMKAPKETVKNMIKVQFIVMEKVAPVVEHVKGKNIKTIPELLSAGNENEVLIFAYDIGRALMKAHQEKILHRDVKLENVFYSKKKKRYVLGDFGIAKKTKDGFAQTLAFTKGYAAPEVKISEERYDNTADIYSFGIMLYVLMNDLKFPDSKMYAANTDMQYQSGYIVPRPEHGISDGFYKVIAKACMFDANQRYQSMDEMVVDIEELIHGSSLGYKKRHKKQAGIVGLLFLVIGAALWIFMGNVPSFQEYSWTIVSFLSLGCILRYQYEVMGMDHRQFTGTLYKQGLFWLVIGITYGMLATIELWDTSLTIRFFTFFLGENFVAHVCAINLKMVGIVGLLFCACWMIREKILIAYEKWIEQ